MSPFLVSIHAAREGRDTDSFIRVAIRNSFNPRGP
tara:strand:- start:4014 stop:4118 length:105 start_codon:yes stop_codon:yes gene_type:complete